MKLFICTRSHDYQSGSLTICAMNREEAAEIFSKYMKKKYHVNSAPYNIGEFKIVKGVVYNDEGR